MQFRSLPEQWNLYYKAYLSVFPNEGVIIGYPVNGRRCITFSRNFTRHGMMRLAEFSVLL
jgi:hypothetical protein